MNARCGMAGGCPNDALGLFRVFGVGDRGLCQVHVAVLERMGAAIRRLDVVTPVPEWRRRLVARDMTGLVLG